MNRRGFLGALARAPLIGPIAAKMAAEQTAANLARVSVIGLGAGVPMGMAATSENAPATPEQWRLAMQIPWASREIVSDLYEQHRSITAIDPDIAAKRSWSLAAKIAYQRQREVVAHIEMMQQEHGWPWQRVQRRVLGALGL